MLPNNSCFKFSLLGATKLPKSFQQLRYEHQRVAPPAADNNNSNADIIPPDCPTCNRNPFDFLHLSASTKITVITLISTILIQIMLTTALTLK